MKNILTILLFGVLISSCQIPFLNDKVLGEGQVDTEFRKVSTYDEIHLQGSLSIHLAGSEMGEIKLNAQKNLMPYIITEVKNNKLLVRIKKGTNLSSDKELSLYIPVGNLKKLELSGSGNVVTENTMITDDLEIELSGSGLMNLEIQSNELECEISGSGSITLSGYTDDLELEISGSGSIRAKNLRAENVDAEISGSGNIYTYVTKKIKGRIDGSGNIYYSGNPNDKNFKSNGSGNFNERSE